MTSSVINPQCFQYSEQVSVVLAASPVILSIRQTAAFLVAGSDTARGRLTLLERRRQAVMYVLMEEWAGARACL